MDDKNHQWPTEAELRDLDNEIYTDDDEIVRMRGTVELGPGGVEELEDRIRDLGGELASDE